MLQPLHGVPFRKEDTMEELELIAPECCVVMEGDLPTKYFDEELFMEEEDLVEEIFKDGAVCSEYTAYSGVL
jgi:hypothetical protein